jgi:hypothetical protein
MCNGNGPATITIYVSRIGQSTNLSLKQGTSTPGQPGDPGGDDLETVVVASQPIEWKINPTPDPGRNNDITLEHVKAADASKPKFVNSQQLLVNAEYTAVSGVITAAVKASPPAPTRGQGPGKKSFENYQIGFYLNSDSNKTEVWDDPKIRMNT